MNNCYTYFLTATSDLKPNCSGEPGNYELDENTYEFEALVEAGPSRMMKTKVYSLGKLPIEVEERIKNRERFRMKLIPQTDKTFMVGV